MAASGTPFQGPKACPFVALELDRDRRSERPDYRHRCYAEPTPAPRSLAHQEAYCLSPGFAACPIFQDWAQRAAAAPVGAAGRDEASPDGSAALAPPAAPLTATAPGESDDSRGASAVPEDLETGVSALSSSGEPPIGEPPLVPPAASVSDPAPRPSAWDDQSDDPAHDAEQLSVFGVAEESPPEAPLTSSPPRSSYGQPDAGYPEPHDVPPPADDLRATVPAGYVPPPQRREAHAPPRVDEPPVPAFLAGRTERQPPGAAAPARPPERMSREEIVPSWDIDRRHGARVPADDERGGSRLDTILTAIAVVAILALGVAGVLFLPGLLAGSPGRTPTPSFGLPSAAPTVLGSAAPSLAVTPAPETAAPPTEAPSVAATPGASPRFYRIKAGDSLMRIARRFDVTVEELLAANPEITDPNQIQVGQRIVIPSPSGT